LYLNAFFDVLDKKSLTAESTYLRNGTYLFGTRAVCDIKNRLLTKWEQGLVWNLSKDTQAGIRHESNCAEGNFKWGTFSFMLHLSEPNQTEECLEFIHNNITRTFWLRYGYHYLITDKLLYKFKFSCLEKEYH